MYRQLEEKKAAPTSAPSGIAQLRKSIDHSTEQPSDPMNLDDFLVPNSIASPAGITPSPEERAAATDHARAAVMPIQSRKVPNQQSTEPLPVSSVPPPSIVTNRSGEFDYVPRRVRKTSSDEGRVSSPASQLPLAPQ
jgi:GATA-binding protein, other eukaryote